MPTPEPAPMFWTAAQTAPRVSPGMAHELAGTYLPSYDVVPEKVASGVKFANPASARSFNPQASPGGIFQALPRRSQPG